MQILFWSMILLGVALLALTLFVGVALQKGQDR